MQPSLTERGDLNSFQVQKPVPFNTKITQRRLVKHRDRPDYRLIERYFKSTHQYQKERQRRRQTLTLSFKGCTISQIAKSLDVSTRTVRRDLARNERYVKAQITKRRDLLAAEQRRELDNLPAKELIQRLHGLTNLMCHTWKLSKKQEYESHNKAFFIDMDHLTPAGFPSLRIDSPGSPFKTPYNINFVGVKDGKTQILGGVKIS